MNQAEQESYAKTMAGCKKPPPIVGDIVAARDAWLRYRKYEELAKRALAKFHRYTPGTTSASTQWGRYTAYSDVAEMWAKVLESYLVDHAQIAIDDAKHDKR